MLKKCTFYGLGLVFVLVFVSAHTAFGLDFKEGRYQITSKTDMPGMPTEMPAVTITQCMTKQQPVPNQDAQNQDCKRTDMKIKGNTVTWQMECDHQGNKTQMTGTMTYSGDSFKGKMVMNMGPQAGNMVVTTHVSGKRIGDCE